MATLRTADVAVLQRTHGYASPSVPPLSQANPFRTGSCRAILGTSSLAAITTIKCRFVKSPPRAATQTTEPRMILPVAMAGPKFRDYLPLLPLSSTASVLWTRQPPFQADTFRSQICSRFSRQRYESNSGRIYRDGLWNSRPATAGTNSQ
jgi:hypothetical protein